jgi:hypothetical protein
MSKAEQRRPLISRLRQALLGKRAGAIASAARTIDSTATYGHESHDAIFVENRNDKAKDRRTS